MAVDVLDDFLDALFDAVVFLVTVVVVVVVWSAAVIRRCCFFCAAFEGFSYFSCFNVGPFFVSCFVSGFCVSKNNWLVS